MSVASLEPHCHRVPTPRRRALPTKQLPQEVLHLQIPLPENFGQTEAEYKGLERRGLVGVTYAKSYKVPLWLACP